MTITRTTITRPDGTLGYHYTTDAPEGVCIMATGPVSGPIRLNDGTEYDVTDDYIEHPAEHTEAILHHIGAIHRRPGGKLEGQPHQYHDTTTPPASAATVDADSHPA